jgi:hypothetical protein
LLSESGRRPLFISDTTWKPLAIAAPSGQASRRRRAAPTDRNPPARLRGSEDFAMTQQEMESELIRLRELETARRANWRPIRIAATFCALMFAVAGVGLSLASLALSHAQHEALQMGLMFIFSSFPMILLSTALRDPTRSR